jgi:hypothetical protein
MPSFRIHAIPLQSSSQLLPIVMPYRLDFCILSSHFYASSDRPAARTANVLLHLQALERELDRSRTEGSASRGVDLQDQHLDVVQLAGKDLAEDVLEMLQIPQN